MHHPPHVSTATLVTYCNRDIRRLNLGSTVQKASGYSAPTRTRVTLRTRARAYPSADACTRVTLRTQCHSRARTHGCLKMVIILLCEEPFKSHILSFFIIRPMRFRPSTLGLLHYHLGYSRVFTVHLVCVPTSHVSSFILSLGVMVSARFSCTSATRMFFHAASACSRRLPAGITS